MSDELPLVVVRHPVLLVVGVATSVVATVVLIVVRVRVTDPMVGRALVLDGLILTVSLLGLVGTSVLSYWFGLRREDRRTRGHRL